MPLIALDPPSIFPLGTGIARLAVPASGSEKYFQFTPGLLMNSPKLIGIRERGCVLDPASTSRTEVRGFAESL